MFTLFASLVTDIQASTMWLWGAACAVVSAITAVPVAVVALF